MNNDKKSGSLRWLWKEAKPFRWWILLSVLLLTAESYSALATVALQQRMIDDVLLGGNPQQFLSIVLLLAGAYLLHAFLFTYASLMPYRTVAKMKKLMSRKLLERMYRLPISLLQKERTATFVYHFSTDLQLSCQFISGFVPRTIQHIASAVVLIWIVALADIKLVLMLLAFSALYFVIGNYFGKRRKLLASDVNKKKSELLVHMEEGVSSTREVIAFHRMKWEDERYNTLFGRYYESAMKEAKLMGRQILFSDPVKWGATLIVLLYGGWLVLEDQLSIGMFVVTFQFSSRLMESFHNIFHFIMKFSAELASVERLRAALHGEITRDGAKSLHDPVASLRFEQVAFRYEGRQDQVLSGISLDFPIGAKIALVGTSGGGKSTVAALLARFYEPEEGAILVNGEPLSEVKRKDWAAKLSVVFQEPYLFPDTIRNNLIMGLGEVTEAALVEACRTAQIHDYIAGLADGYDTLIGERGITLSGGQRQRLAIARALLKDAELLLLDEATSALDLETERQLQHHLDERRKGKTTIIIAHRLSTVQNADVIYVFDRGTVSASGTHEELMRSSSVYQGLVLKYRAQETA
ncbi:ABC transporter ATP-binding protein [Paenibacillus turpanensis]|uniref:ABC transporter ATP-binding protein n=1 Tax=Paenibacillus turpanensis TaxID=2689078 RepID=UPI001407F839|nr:ABC transporter ATP-binding protein [Paenibacillus turpanensis]